MRPSLRFLFLIPVIALIASCRTINTAQSTVVRKFASTSKEVSDLPYKIMFSYYSVKFKRKQLLPEHYVIGDTTKEYLDLLAGEVMMTIEDLRDAYYSDIRTANKIKTVYQLLETYIHSLEVLSSDKYSRDFEKRSDEIGKRMNGLVSGFNASPGRKINLPLNPGEWLSSLVTMHGRTKIKSMQAKILKDYITQADTFVQAINRNYQEIQMNDMIEWFKDEKAALNEQFKRIISSYLQYISRNYRNSSSMAALEFYSRINPIYYELTDEIYRDEELIKQTSMMMNNLAATHSSMKSMFTDGNNWVSVAEEVDVMKEKLFIIKDLFNKEGQEKFSFYKNFIMQNENAIKNLINKQ